MCICLLQLRLDVLEKETAFFLELLKFFLFILKETYDEQLV